MAQGFLPFSHAPARLFPAAVAPVARITDVSTGWKLLRGSVRVIDQLKVPSMAAFELGRRIELSR